MKATDADAKRRASDKVRAACRWAKHHEGVTCMEATAASAFWCLACKRAYQAELP